MWYAKCTTLHNSGFIISIRKESHYLIILFKRKFWEFLSAYKSLPSCLMCECLNWWSQMNWWQQKGAEGYLKESIHAYVRTISCVNACRFFQIGNNARQEMLAKPFKVDVVIYSSSINAKKSCSTRLFQKNCK